MIRGFFKNDQKYHINPRHRAYGKARIDIVQRVKTQQDWDELWKEPANSFPFNWGGEWKHCVEYKVDDYAAEVGFWIDILGLSVNALGADYAQFTSPGGDFYLGVAVAPDGEKSTPPESLRLQFNIKDLFKAVTELERRGIKFEGKPEPIEMHSPLFLCYFRTPHGICVDLWGEVNLENIPKTVEEPGSYEVLLQEQSEISPQSMKTAIKPPTVQGSEVSENQSPPSARAPSEVEPQPMEPEILDRYRARTERRAKTPFQAKPPAGVSEEETNTNKHYPEIRDYGSIEQDNSLSPTPTPPPRDPLRTNSTYQDGSPNPDRNPEQRRAFGWAGEVFFTQPGVASEEELDSTVNNPAVDGKRNTPRKQTNNVPKRKARPPHGKGEPNSNIDTLGAKEEMAPSPTDKAPPEAIQYNDIDTSTDEDNNIEYLVEDSGLVYEDLDHLPPKGEGDDEVQ